MEYDNPLQNYQCIFSSLHQKLISLHMSKCNLQWDRFEVLHANHRIPNQNLLWAVTIKIKGPPIFYKISSNFQSFASKSGS